MAEPTTEIVVVDTTPLPAIDTPEAVVARATAEAEVLAAVIEDRHLYAVTGRDRKTGKEKRHVQVEGWQTLGAMRGVFALTEWSRRTDDFQAFKATSEWKTNDSGKRYKEQTVAQEGIGGWEARVHLVNANGVIVGAAEAECTWEEEAWQERPSNALRSMAQTRAIGKAYRGVFAFVMALAGYSVTPAEEMPPPIPSVPDLHNLPDGWKGENWAKQVALVVAQGQTEAARTMYTLALDGVGEDPAEMDVAAWEAVVELLHGADGSESPY